MSVHEKLKEGAYLVAFRLTMAIFTHPDKRRAKEGAIKLKAFLVSMRSEGEDIYKSALRGKWEAMRRLYCV